MPIRSVYLYFGVAVLVVALGLGLRNFVFNDQRLARAGKPVEQGSSGTPSIGGAFTLVDHNGNTVSEKDFAGRHMLVFFGYTNCPDVCPLTLNTLTEVLDKMGKDADKIRPVFVSVDPRRDSPKVIKEYLSNFHKSFIGPNAPSASIRKSTRIRTSSPIPPTKIQTKTRTRMIIWSIIPRSRTSWGRRESSKPLSATQPKPTQCWRK